MFGYGIIICTSVFITPGNQIIASMAGGGLLWGGAGLISTSIKGAR
jgi:hypothetical protein